MAYTNIRFTKPHMVVVDNNFFMFDDAYDKLVQKTDGGDTVFEYPLDVDLTTVSGLTLGAVLSAQHDRTYFWTLQLISSNQGIVIRKWLVDNYVCKIQENFIYSNTGVNTYYSRAFGVEHYLTDFSSSFSSGSNTISISEYYNTVVSSGTVLSLGPNSEGEREDVTVSGVIGSDIILDGGLQYSYTTDDQVVMSRSLFVFNDYDGTDSANGSLIRFNSLDGSYMSVDVNVEYKIVYAATFSRFQNILSVYPDAHALVYIKGTNAKLRNMSDLIDLTDASSVNDDFTGADGSLPNNTRWTITNGNPRIYNNALYSSTVINGTDEIESNYELVGDFDVEVSGTVGGYTNASGSSDFSFNHYMKLSFPHNDDHYTSGGFYYVDALPPVANNLNFYTAVDGTNDTVIPITGDSNDYRFRINRSGSTVSFYYKASTSGIFNTSWTTLDTNTAYTGDCVLSLGLSSSYVTVSGSYFDDLIYNSGYIKYPVVEVPYYGIMNIDNVRSNGSTIITVYDISIVGDSMYRLQDEATYYGVDNDWGSQYNYQVSPIRPFLDFITVGASPEILPATGRNVSQITAVVLDQYGEGSVNKPVDFTDDDSIGFMTSSQVYTDYFFGTGEAKTNYMSGTALRLVTVEGTATQYD